MLWFAFDAHKSIFEDLFAGELIKEAKVVICSGYNGVIGDEADDFAFQDRNTIAEGLTADQIEHAVNGSTLVID